MAWAAKLGISDAEKLLEATLDEKATDEKLTELADLEINIAADEAEEDERPRRAAGGRR